MSYHITKRMFPFIIIAAIRTADLSVLPVRDYCHKKGEAFRFSHCLFCFLTSVFSLISTRTR